MNLAYSGVSATELADEIYAIAQRPAYSGSGPRRPRVRRWQARKIVPLAVTACGNDVRQFPHPTDMPYVQARVQQAVESSLGPIMLLLLRWVLPYLIELVVNWYFSGNGVSMRRRYQAQAQRGQ